MRITSILQHVAKSTKRYSNLPDSYIKRVMEQVEWRNPSHVGPMYAKGNCSKRRQFVFDEHRPWTQEFFHNNVIRRPFKEIPVEPIRDWSFFKGDRVEVLVGPDKGKQGLVNYIVEERNWVFVEGLNCDYKIFGKTHDFPGFMVKREKPLLVTSDVALVDPRDELATTVEWRYTEAGDKVRVSCRSELVLPIPMQDEETVDYKTKATYVEQPKDTVESIVTEPTFEPMLCTFAMDILKSSEIENTRTPKKSYWYYVEELA